MDDRELNQLLREWKAPAAPARLGAPRTHGAGPGRRLVRRSPGGGGGFSGVGWRWLLTGSIRVPVPVGAAAAALLAFWLFSGSPAREPVTEPPPTPEPVVSLADFQPVEAVEPRVVGGVH